MHAGQLGLIITAADSDTLRVALRVLQLVKAHRLHRRRDLFVRPPKPQVEVRVHLLSRGREQQGSAVGSVNADWFLRGRSYFGPLFLGSLLNFGVN